MSGDPNSAPIDERDSATVDERPRDVRRRSDLGRHGTLVNAIIGAVVTVVTSFVPISPVIGGAVAGYLQKGSRREGLKVGVLSGLLASLPILFILSLVFGGLSLAAFAGGEIGGSVLFGMILLVSIGFVILVVVGLSALGGYVGVALAERERGAGVRQRADVRTSEPARTTAPGGRDDRYRGEERAIDEPEQGPVPDEREGVPPTDGRERDDRGPERGIDEPGVDDREAADRGESDRDDDRLDGGTEGKHP